MGGGCGPVGGPAGPGGTRRGWAPLLPWEHVPSPPSLEAAVCVQRSLSRAPAADATSSQHLSALLPVLVWTALSRL